MTKNELREKATLMAKLRDVIFRKMNENSSDSDDWDSIIEYYDSDEQIDEMKFSISSSDLDSIESDSESESFQDMLTVINHKFKSSIDKLFVVLKRNIDNSESSESEFDDDDNEDKDKAKHDVKKEVDVPDENSSEDIQDSHLNKSDSRNYELFQNIKQEVEDKPGCKRHKKAEQKLK